MAARRKKKAITTKIQRSLNSSMWRRGDISVMKNLPPSCRRRVYSNARSEVPVPRRPAAPLWRVGYAECCDQEQLLCVGGSVASTVESPDWCNSYAVCKSSMLCCCSTAVDSIPCMRVASIRLSSGPTRAAGTEKVRDPKSAIYGGHVLQANGD